jgi:hypothetical protein
MATSGTSSFTRARDQICHTAGRKIGAIRAGETMSNSMLTDFVEGLNLLVKHWQGKGLHVWTVTEATLFPQVAQVRYALALTGADHATRSFVATTAAVAAIAAATTITVDDDDGILDNDHLGITLTDGTLFWTTVNGTPAANVVTFDDALTGAVTADAAVYAYTTKIVRPLKIVEARSYDPTTYQEISLSVMSRMDYLALPNKTAIGAVNQVFYDPQLTTGYLYLWLAQTSVRDLVKFTWWRPIEDFNAAGDNADLPQEWLQTLIFNLAVVMAPEFGVPTERLAATKALADEFLSDMQGFDRDGESIQFGVEMG